MPVSCARRTNLVMPAPDDGDAPAHRRSTATAAEVLGTPRHDCTTADAAVARAELLDAGEGPREAVRLVEVALAERAAARGSRDGIEAGEPERVEMLELLVRERVVDLGQVHVAGPIRPGRSGARGALGGGRPVPVAALDRRARPGSSRRRRPRRRPRPRSSSASTTTTQPSRARAACSPVSGSNSGRRDR